MVCFRYTTVHTLYKDDDDDDDDDVDNDNDDDDDNNNNNGRWFIHFRLSNN